MSEISASSMSGALALPIQRPRWPISDLLFQVAACLSILLGLSLVCTLLIQICYDGFPRLSWAFITNSPSRFADKAGIYCALLGSAYLMLLTIAISLPLGVGAAIYLEEYASRNFFTSVIELNIANLAGVPSIIYGLLGLQLFVRALSFDRSILSGALTLTILILPVVIIATREAIRAVPKSIREASIALGATKWQTVRHHVLPVALPGIMTGCILAFSRAIGETAPLVTIGALSYIAHAPDSIFSDFTALPIQIFNWVSRPQEAFHLNAAAAMVVLLGVLLILNSVAIWLRVRYQRRVR